MLLLLFSFKNLPTFLKFNLVQVLDSVESPATLEVLLQAVKSVKFIAIVDLEDAIHPKLLFAILEDSPVSVKDLHVFDILNLLLLRELLDEVLTVRLLMNSQKNQGPTNLHRLFHAWRDLNRLSCQHERAKLGKLVPQSVRAATIVNLSVDP